MRKKLLLGLLVIVGLFAITGCGKSSNIETNINKKINDNKEVVTIQGEKFNLSSERVLGGIHYQENYVDFNTDQIGNMRTMNYSKEGKSIFEVRVMYDENRSDSELKAIVETQTGAKQQSKEINGIKYIYYEYTADDGATVHHYMYVFNGKVYTIGFFLGEKPGDIEEVFMNNVSFK